MNTNLAQLRPSALESRVSPRLICLFASLLFCVTEGPQVRGQGTFQKLNTGSFVVPSDAENTEGDSFGYYDNITPYQQLVTPAAFPALPPSGIVLTAMSFRVDVSHTPCCASSDERFDSFSVTLSTDPAAPSNWLFAPGADQTTVFSSGPITFHLQTFAQPGPAPFEIRVPFATPFFYEPGRPLLVELGGHATGGNDALVLDYTSSPNLSTRGLSPIGGSVFIRQGGFPLAFEYRIPEPRTDLTFFLAWLLRPVRHGARRFHVAS